jgi:hypothetical protein
MDIINKIDEHKPEIERGLYLLLIFLFMLAWIHQITVTNKAIRLIKPGLECMQTNWQGVYRMNLTDYIKKQYIDNNYTNHMYSVDTVRRVKELTST